jgi:3-keto-5-aminohexanoate cleavage enzyme
MTGDERLQPVVDLPEELRPEMASLNTGSVNFGDEVFLNPPAMIEAFALAMRERGIKPEVEVYEAGMIENAVRLVRRGILDEPLQVNVVLGVPGGAPATPRQLLYMVESLPAGATWTVTGVGRQQLPMGVLGMVLGGNVRTGLEDNIYYRKGELATSNAQLVGRVARVAGELDRAVATPAEARALLGLLRR